MQTIARHPISAQSEQAAQTPLPSDLAPKILDRLRREGVTCCEEWLALGVQRGRIFGVTKRTRREVDAVVAAALKVRT